jgi:predicted PurR-regulated permease PerM
MSCLFPPQGQRHQSRDVTVTNSSTPPEKKAILNQSMEAAIRIGLAVLMAAWCFQIIRPFIVPIIWGVIIAVATFPGYRRMVVLTGGRKRIGAVFFTLVLLALLIGPTLIMGDTLLTGIKSLGRDLSDGSLTIPPPPESVGGWPIVGKSLERLWALASTNLQEALREVGPQLRSLSKWLLSAATSIGFALLQFVFAIVIAGLLMSRSEICRRLAVAVAVRIEGGRGEEFVDLTRDTIRSVARGIVGVALIQSFLAGIGFLAVGLPAAGLLALICLVLAVIQLGPGLIIIPAIVYVFSTADTLPAVLFAVWGIGVTLLDNLLKPMLLGRGVKVPMVVIFVGAIGGFLAYGIVGLFVGAVVLALGRELFMEWLKEKADGVTSALDPGH